MPFNCQICGKEEDLKRCPKCRRHICNGCLDVQISQGFDKKLCLYCGHAFWKKKVIFEPSKAVEAVKKVVKKAQEFKRDRDWGLHISSTKEPELVLRINLLDALGNPVDLTNAKSVKFGEQDFFITNRKEGIGNVRVSQETIDKWNILRPQIYIEFNDGLVVTMGSDEELDEIFKNLTIEKRLV